MTENNVRYTAVLIIVAILVTNTMAAQTLNPNDPVDLYCGVVGALAKTILSGRDKGVSMSKVRHDVLQIKIVQENPQLQNDVKEMVNFVFVTAPDTPSEKLSDFIMNDWCINLWC